RQRVVVPVPQLEGQGEHPDFIPFERDLWPAARRNHRFCQAGIETRSHPQNHVVTRPIIERLLNVLRVVRIRLEFPQPVGRKEARAAPLLIPLRVVLCTQGDHAFGPPVVFFFPGRVEVVISQERTSANRAAEPDFPAQYLDGLGLSGRVILLAHDSASWGGNCTRAYKGFPVRCKVRRSRKKPPAKSTMALKYL